MNHRDDGYRASLTGTGTSRATAAGEPEPRPWRAPRCAKCGRAVTLHFYMLGLGHNVIELGNRGDGPELLTVAEHTFPCAGVCVGRPLTVRAVLAELVTFANTHWR